MAEDATRLFVTKIPPRVPREEVAEYFSRFGTTTDVYVPTVPGAVFHKGIAFVSFSDPGSMQIALGSGPHELGGQEIVLDVAAPKGTVVRGGGCGGCGGCGGVAGAAPQAPAPVPVEQALVDRLFVTKVPQTLNQEQLRMYFEQFGVTTDVYMPQAPGLGSATHKGICFVSFADPQSVQACLAQRPHEINGCQVIVDVAAPRGAPGQKGGMRPQFGQQVQYLQQPVQQPPRLQYIQQPAQQVRFVQPAQQFQQAQVRPPQAGVYGQVAVQQPMGQGAPVAVQGAPVSGRLFLTRVPMEVTREDLQMYFQQFGQLQDVYIPNGGKGIAFVSFADHAVAQEVLQSRQHFVKEGQAQPINVEQALDRPALHGDPGASFRQAPAAQQLAAAPPAPSPAAALDYRPY